MIRVILTAVIAASTVSFALAADLRRTGICEASAAAILPDGRLAVASDERRKLAVYRRSDTVPERSKSLGKVDDIEGAARIGDTVFWITSHGLTRGGKDKQARRKLLATRANDGELPKERGKKFDHLRGVLAGALSVLGVAGTLSEILEALDIEGLAATADGGLLVALRAPLSKDGRALLVHVPDPFDLLKLDGPRSGRDGLAVLALDLGGRGVRAITRDPAGTYVIVAGPSDDEDKTFALYTWSGTDAPHRVTGVDLSDMQPEAIVVWETGLAEVLGDNAKACKKKDGKKPEPEDRWFPSRTIRY